ncbi:MAG: hypothetical protein QW172_02665 [Candidatus Bathyarchaeia archaeon]
MPKTCGRNKPLNANKMKTCQDMAAAAKRETRSEDKTIQSKRKR